MIDGDTVTSVQPCVGTELHFQAGTLPGRHNAETGAVFPKASMPPARRKAGTGSETLDAPAHARRSLGTARALELAGVRVF